MSEFIPDYSKYQTNELLDIYLRMDKFNNPKMKVAIEIEIRKRLCISDSVSLEDPELQNNFMQLTTVVIKQKSRFVNILAWISIIMAGVSILISLVNLVLFSRSFNPVLKDSNVWSVLTPAAKFFLSHPELFIITGLVYYTSGLVSGIGLLKRKEWARKLFIGLLVLMIVYSLLSPIISQLFIPNIQFTGYGGESFSLESMKSYMLVVGMVFGVSFSILFGFLIYKLSNPVIKEEFI